MDVGWVPARSCSLAPRGTVRRIADVRAEGWPTLTLPTTFAVIGLGAPRLRPLPAARHARARAGRGRARRVIGRAVLTFREKLRLLEAAGRGAHRLADGARQSTPLHRRTSRSTSARRTSAPLVLVLFDLDGFKLYNDTFGHPAGDSLLARLGGQARDGGRGAGRGLPDGRRRVLRARLRGTGRPRRADLGGGHGAQRSREKASRSTAPTARSCFPRRRTASRTRCGSPTSGCTSQEPAPADGRTPEHGRAAPRAARARLGAGAAPGERRRPRRGRRVGASACRPSSSSTRQAAELHDVGKVAIPEPILAKPGPLTDAEWEIVRRHPLVGERILAAAPALGQVARLVRSTHERFDGTGLSGRPGGTRDPAGRPDHRRVRRLRRHDVGPPLRAGADVRGGALASCCAAPGRSTTPKWSRRSSKCTRASATSSSRRPSFSPCSAVPATARNKRWWNRKSRGRERGDSQCEELYLRSSRWRLSQ